MIQLGNLAVICAKRSDVTLTVAKGIATLTAGEGTEQKQYAVEWQNNAEIDNLIHELNFGALRENSTQD